MLGILASGKRQILFEYRCSMWSSVALLSTATAQTRDNRWMEVTKTDVSKRCYVHLRSMTGILISLTSSANIRQVYQWQWPHISPGQRKVCRWRVQWVFWKRKWPATFIRVIRMAKSSVINCQSQMMPILSSNLKIHPRNWIAMKRKCWTLRRVYLDK